MFLRLISRLRRRNFNADLAARAVTAYSNALGGEDGDMIIDDLAARFRILEPSATADDAFRREGAMSVITYMDLARHEGGRLLNTKLSQRNK